MVLVSAINGDLFHLKLDKLERYTDTIKLSVSPQDSSINLKNYIVSIDGKQETTSADGKDCF